MTDEADQLRALVPRTAYIESPCLRCGARRLVPPGIYLPEMRETLEAMRETGYEVTHPDYCKQCLRAQAADQGTS